MAEYCRDDFGLVEQVDDDFKVWQGLVGPHYTPSVSEDGTLSWTNDGQLPNPEDVNIKGPPGEGEPGPGVPAGGTTGQILAKASDEDYDGEWIDPPEQPEMDAGHVSYDSTEAYDDGTVGKELTTINSALSSLQSVTEIIDTASGAIASFPDGSGLPMRSLVAEINPVQDLHGQSSPWPAGGGANKLMLTGRSAVTSGAWSNSTPRDFSEPHAFIGISSDGYFYNGYISSYAITEESVTLTTTNNGFGVGLSYSCQPETQYTFSYDNKEVGTIGFGFYDADGAYLSFAGTGTLADYTFTTPANCVNLMIVFRPPRDIEKTYTHPVLSIGSSATWTPYSNLCPISGWTGVTGKRIGKNLCNPDTFDLKKWVTASGEIYALANGAIGEEIKVIGGGTYTVGYNGVAPYSFGFVELDANHSFIKRNLYLTMSGNKAEAYTTTANTRYIYPIVSAESGTITTDVIKGIKLQLELGSTASTYEEYTGEPISVSFPTTVYGGSDEVIGGNGISTMGMVDLGALDWTYITNDGTPYYFRATADGRATGSFNIVSSIFKTSSAAGTRNLPDCGIVGSSSMPYVFVRWDAYTDATAFKTAVTGQTLVYELATPITYQLTPQEVDTLLGQNNVWVDTGSVSVEYPADTKLYIDKKIAELGS